MTEFKLNDCVAIPARKGPVNHDVIAYVRGFETIEINGGERREYLALEILDPSVPDVMLHDCPMIERYRNPRRDPFVPSGRGWWVASVHLTPHPLPLKDQLTRIWEQALL